MTERPEQIRATLVVPDLKVSPESAPPDAIEVESWATEQEGEFKETTGMWQKVGDQVVPIRIVAKFWVVQEDS